jgi:E3 ubiquitin-protein ligase mind-bomb
LSCIACAHAQTPEERLFEAIEEGKPLVAEGIVARGEVKLDARNKERETPLHLAIEKGMKELAAMLVKAGAPVGARSSNGETPLHLAALHSDSWFVDLLLEAKADPKARNDDGESVLQWAVMTGNSRTAQRLLTEARTRRSRT